MKKNKIIISLMILTIILYSLFGIILQNTSLAVNQTKSEDINSINETKYPGIKQQIQQLQSKYPNWKFKILYTGLDWNDVINNEYTGHGKSPKNLIYKSASYQGEWICAICGESGYDNGNWKCASDKAIKYMMDVRNSINESDIFQFEELTSTDYNIETIRTMTRGTFLEGHEQGIINASKNNNINAYYIVARLIQEQGSQGSVLAKGTGYNGVGVGFYNAFNIAASGNSTAEILTNALLYAQKQGWSSLDASIDGGIKFLAKQYIKKGQNTLYLQKFDVEATNGLYSNQYMQNIMAAQSEGSKLRSEYVKLNTFSSAHTFIIPVYENMPSEISKRPNESVTNKIEKDLVKVNVDNTLRIRNNPNGSTTVGWLYKNEIVTRVEKATSKVAGTYWDKIQKDNGTTGYVARETYENEGKYKLYLVSLNNYDSNTENNNVQNNNVSNNSNQSSKQNNEKNNLKDTAKVKIDQTNKIVTVTPDSIAKDILDANGGPIKITKADGNFLPNGENELVATGFVIDDKYTVVKKGDCNGDGSVDAFDYIRIMNYIMKKRTLNNAEQLAADANKDGKIDSFDYIRIMNYIMGKKQIEI